MGTVGAAGLVRGDAPCRPGHPVGRDGRGSGPIASRAQGIRPTRRRRHGGTIDGVSGGVRRGPPRVCVGRHHPRPIPLPHRSRLGRPPPAGRPQAGWPRPESCVRPRRFRVARRFRDRHRSQLVRIRCGALARRLDAVAMGYDAATVDAGYEWVGYHANGAGNADPGYGITWYDDWIANARPCAVVSNTQVELGRFRLIGVDRRPTASTCSLVPPNRCSCTVPWRPRVRGFPPGLAARRPQTLTGSVR